MIAAKSYRWRQRGTMSMWRYLENTRNYPGWHFSADDAGCASMLALLDVLFLDPAGTTRTLQLTAPSEEVLSVPNNRGASVEGPVSLRVSHAVDPEALSWSQEGDRLVLEIGQQRAPMLRKGIADVAAGYGDYSIATIPLPLWFWWWPRAAST